MYPTYRAARLLPLGALLLIALGSCQDNSLPTAPLSLHPNFTQSTSSPVVNSLADPGDGTCDDTECTLREAISFATSGATITFSVTGTITLSGTQLRTDKNLTISGPGADQLTISGNGSLRVFNIGSGSSTISGLTITGGYVPSVGGGAGIINYATLTIIDCLITGNNAVYSQGAGVRNVGGTLVVRSSAVSANTGVSGAIFSDGTLLVVNSTVSGNLHPAGGPVDGIHNYAGSARIVSSTIFGNANGVMTYYSAGTTTQIKNSLIWGNTNDDVFEYSDGLTTSLGYNLIGTTGSTALASEFTETGDQKGVINANIGALAVNTPGKTPTHALLAGSTAIDAGSCTDHLGATITTDQRGVGRPQGSACDIGAYELVASGSTTPTFTFNLSTLPAKTFGDGSFSVAGASYVTTNSTGAVTFATGAGSVGCSVTSAGMVSLTGAAVDPSHCILEASLAADATYTSAGPISQDFNIAKAAGSVTISNLPASGAIGGNFTPTYTKSGDGTASTESKSSSVCTVTDGVVDFIAAGTCLLQASVTAGTNHLAATGSEQSFPVSLVTPTFTFDLSAVSPTYGDGEFSVASHATTNSTGAVTFALGASSVGCSVTSAGMVTVSGAAVDPSHCIIAATLAADGSYAGAGPIEQSFNIAKAPGSVTISNLPASGAIGGSFTPTYTKAGDGTASTVSNSTGVCTVTDGVVNYIAAGTCLLQASVTEGTNHLAATGTEQSFTISAVVPTFAFDLSGLAAKAYGDGTFSVAGPTYVTTNSTGAVTFALGAGSVGCSVTSAGTVTISGAAVDPSHCIIAATLAAHGAYAGAGPIEQSFNIARAAGSVSIDNMPTSPIVGGQFTPTYAKLGDGTASVVSLTTSVCTVTAGVVSFIAAGDCILQASVTEGTNHQAATGAQQSVTVSGPVFTSSCTYTINPKNDQRQVTVSWANASPGVTQIQVTDGRIMTKQLAPTAAGSWSTSVKTGTPAYGLWGGTSRRDTTTILKPAGSACVLQ